MADSRNDPKRRIHAEDQATPPNAADKQDDAREPDAPRPDRVATESAPADVVQAENSAQAATTQEFRPRTFAPIDVAIPPPGLLPAIIAPLKFISHPRLLPFLVAVVVATATSWITFGWVAEDERGIVADSFARNTPTLLLLIALLGPLALSSLLSRGRMINRARLLPKLHWFVAAVALIAILLPKLVGVSVYFTPIAIFALAASYPLAARSVGLVGPWISGGGTEGRATKFLIVSILPILFGALARFATEVNVLRPVRSTAQALTQMKDRCGHSGDRAECKAALDRIGLVVQRNPSAGPQVRHLESGPRLLDGYHREVKALAAQLPLLEGNFRCRGSTPALAKTRAENALAEIEKHVSTLEQLRLFANLSSKAMRGSQRNPMFGAVNQWLRQRAERGGGTPPLRTSVFRDLSEALTRDLRLDRIDTYKDSRTLHNAPCQDTAGVRSCPIIATKESEGGMTVVRIGCLLRERDLGRQRYTIEFSERDDRQAFWDSLKRNEAWTFEPAQWPNLLRQAQPDGAIRIDMRTVTGAPYPVTFSLERTQREKDQAYERER